MKKQRVINTDALIARLQQATDGFCERWKASNGQSLSTALKSGQIVNVGGKENNNLPLKR